MEVRPHEQIVVKVDGSRRLTLRYRRFVRELDPGGSSTSDKYNPTTDTKTGKDEDEEIRSDAAHMEPAVICNAHTITTHSTQAI